MIEWLIKKYSSWKIIIINQKEENTPVEELTKYIVSIMNVYVAKVNGLGKYKSDIKSTIKIIKNRFNKRFKHIVYHKLSFVCPIEPLLNLYWQTPTVRLVLVSDDNLDIPPAK